MKKKSLIHNSEWHKEIDFAVVALSIIMFGAAVAYVMITAVQ